jgi:hypothetical protein
MTRRDREEQGENREKTRREQGGRGKNWGGKGGEQRRT